MALYRLRMRTISRGRGEISVAASAYITGEALYLEAENCTYDFSWRSGVVHTELFGAHGWSREEMWNEAEWAEWERRWDGVTAREILVALPHELPLQGQIELARELAGHLEKTYGVAVDLAVHVPTGHAGQDERNVHAHLLLTRRRMTREGLAERIAVWDDPISTGPAELRKLRRQWRRMQNRALRRARLEVRVDDRSYDEQGVQRIPGVPLGPILTRLERQSNPVYTALGDHNRIVQILNRIRDALEPELGWDWDQLPEITDRHLVHAFRVCGGKILATKQAEASMGKDHLALSAGRRREMRRAMADLEALYVRLRPAIDPANLATIERRKSKQLVGERGNRDL